MERLDDIGRALSGRMGALALLGLGSAGLETDRLDEWSDLDFFVIVAAGQKAGFLKDLGWLEAVCPVAYKFMNTQDGYKLLFADGVFCEFAVFEMDELAGIPYPPARIVWKRTGVPEAIGSPAMKPSPVRSDRRAWLIGEALTNLYVGLGREQRGEKLSALRFIQGYAVDRLVELVEATEAAGEGARDPFVPERRFEARFPGAAERLAAWCPGYGKNVEAAQAILAFLEERFEVDAAMAEAVRRLMA